MIDCYCSMVTAIVPIVLVTQCQIGEARSPTANIDPRCNCLASRKWPSLALRSTLLVSRQDSKDSPSVSVFPA